MNAHEQSGGGLSRRDGHAVEPAGVNTDAAAVNVTRNISSSYASAAVNIIVPLIMIPLFVRYLGMELYGQWIIVLSLVSYLPLANLGIAQALQNRMADASARGMRGELGGLVSTGFVAYAAVAAFLVVALYLITPSVAAGISASGAGSRAFLVFALLAAAAFPLKVNSMLLRGIERVDRDQTIGILARVIQALGTIVVLLAGFKLIAVALVSGATALVEGFASLWASTRLCAEARPRLARFSSKLLSSLIPASAGFLVLQLGLTFVYGIDNLVIGYAIGAQHVPAYAVPFRLIWTANGLFYVAVSAVTPSITQRFSRGEREYLGGRFSTGMRLAIFYATACAIALWLVGPSFIRWWAGPSVYPGAPTFGLQIGYLILLVLATPGYGVVMATTKHYRYAALSVVEGALNLSLSLWWVRRFGIAGVIAATVVASLLTTAWYLPTAAARILGLGVGRITRELAGPALVAFVALATTAALSHQVGDDSLLRSSAVMLVVELVFVAGFSRLALSREEREAARVWIVRTARVGIQAA